MLRYHSKCAFKTCPTQEVEKTHVRHNKQYLERR